MEKVKRLSVGLLPHRLFVVQTALLLVCSFVIFTSQASAVIRFNNRSLTINNSEPGATTQYTISLTYNNQAVPSTTVGSIDLLFCYDPIPSEPITAQNPVDHHPCVTPTGLDVSNAALSNQTGETGFTILSKSTNHIILTRTPGAVSEMPSSYTFDNIVNPTDETQSFAIRLSSYSSTDATGQVLNLGSVVTQIGEGVTLETQVPPQLIFCLGKTVDMNCQSDDGIHYTDMGDLSPDTTLTATSQMAAGTNASNGYVITTNGTTMEAGTSVINALATPTASAAGNSQFGLNVVANSSPGIGADPDGLSTNGVAAADYSIPNEFKFQDGDVVAEAPAVSLFRRYTVSYIVNSPPDLRAGVYTTTITYICSGRF